MYYIFTTKIAAQDYNYKVVNSRVLGDKTHDWAIIFKHPTRVKWAILVHPDVEIDGKSSQDLTSDWFSNDI